ncbi:MAG: hypothetical protein HDR01_01435 [Lachnospiraceae bacterium]|nr:hypothetical protein [Lachnospiraceae bacterium]
MDEAIDVETDEVRYESIGNFWLNILGIGTGANANATIHSEFDVCFDRAVGGVNSTGMVLDLIKWIKKIMEVIGKEIKKSIGRD